MHEREHKINEKAKMEAPESDFLVLLNGSQTTNGQTPFIRPDERAIWATRVVYSTNAANDGDVVIFE
jgi:hypothetical protein